MNRDSVEKPVFFVGMPRSGTTVIFEVFAARRDVAWFSQHAERAPWLPQVALLSRMADISPAMRRSVGRTDQVRSWLEKARIGPNEAYAVWERCCGKRFLYDYLLGATATDEERDCLRRVVSQTLRFHGKPRFAAKITGPGRIGYLRSIFPDARFIHVVRDGRAVVRSLLRVYFWKDTWRMNEPAWQNGLTETDLAAWAKAGRSPLALAAVQWSRVTQSIREEAASVAPGAYAEIRYEDFVKAPGETLNRIAEAAEMPPSPEAEAFLERRVHLRDMNYQWQTTFTPEEIETATGLMKAELEAFGYVG